MPRITACAGAIDGIRLPAIANMAVATARRETEPMGEPLEQQCHRASADCAPQSECATVRAASYSPPHLGPTPHADPVAVSLTRIVPDGMCAKKFSEKCDRLGSGKRSDQFPAAWPTTRRYTFKYFVADCSQLKLHDIAV